MGEENLWIGTGTVVQDVKSGRTREGDEVCSFQLQTTSRNGQTAWVRINVYDGRLVRFVVQSIRHNMRVRVEGELMNRSRAGGKAQGGAQLTEIRAFVVTPDSMEKTINA